MELLNVQAQITNPLILSINEVIDDLTRFFQKSHSEVPKIFLTTTYIFSSLDQLRLLFSEICYLSLFTGDEKIVKLTFAQLLSI